MFQRNVARYYILTYYLIILIVIFFFQENGGHSEKETVVQRISHDVFSVKMRVELIAKSKPYNLSCPPVFCPTHDFELKMFSVLKHIMSVFFSDEINQNSMTKSEQNKTKTNFFFISLTVLIIFSTTLFNYLFIYWVCCTKLNYSIVVIFSCS